MNSKLPKHSKTQKNQVPSQTGHLLQNHFQNNIGSCVLLWITSNTFHTSYLNYPGLCLATVTPVSRITIFILKVCRLTSTGRFKHLQGKLSIGEAWGNFKEAHTIFRPHSKFPHCHIQIQLNKLFFKVLSPYLGILKLWFVKQKCSL